MTVSLIGMPSEILYKITSYVGTPVLAALRLVNRFFSKSEVIHQQLFTKPYPHLNVAPLPSSWKQLYLARCEAEQNMLNGIFEVETITLPDDVFTEVLFTSSQGKSFVTYFKYRVGNSLFIRDLQSNTIFEVDLGCALFPGHCIQECNDKIYLLIWTSGEIIIFKIENALEEIFRHDAVANSIRLIPHADQPWFYIAATFIEGKIKIWDKDREEIASNPIKPGKILNSYSENNNYYILFRRDLNDLHLKIYNLFTQEKKFKLSNPYNVDQIGSHCDTRISKINNSRILTFLTLTNFWEYEIPEASNESGQIEPIHYQSLLGRRSINDIYNTQEQGADLMKIRGTRTAVMIVVMTYWHFWAKQTISLHIGLPPHCKSLKLLETWGARGGSNQDLIKISEPKGLPILIVRVGHTIKILKFNIKPLSTAEKWGKLIGRIVLLALGLFLGYLLIKQHQRIFGLLRSSIATNLP